MDEAQRWRARAARYREFADLAMDGAARARRRERASHFERLADRLEGGTHAASPHPVSAGSALRRTLSRVVGFWANAT